MITFAMMWSSVDLARKCDAAPAQVKDQRKELSVQQNLWLRAARTWLQRRWLLCLFSLALLLLLGTAVLRSGAHEAYQLRDSGRLPILASAGCALSDCT